MLRLGLLLVLLAIGGCAASGDEAVVPSDVRTVHLAGRFETSYRGRPPRGAYGLRVYLLFRRSDGTGWEHAVPPSGRSRRHRTFDVLAEDGSFRFDLATADDLSAYDEVAVVPALQSDAVRLVPTPAGARTLDDTTTVLPLADAIRVPLPASGPVRAEALHAEVRPEVGVIVRYATLSREFVSALYDAFDEEMDITSGHVLHAAKEIIPLSYTMKEKIDEMREWATSRARSASTATETPEAGPLHGDHRPYFGRRPNGAPQATSHGEAYIQGSSRRTWLLG